jgi:biopolymer transport protein ExbD
MITRPLELAARLRPEPRNFDWLFFVNGGCIVLFFSLFGSPFVLAPGVAVNIPTVAGATGSAMPATAFITVTDTGQIIAGDGPRTLAQLPEWLKAEARKAKEPVLLVTAGQGVTLAVATEIVTAANRAGFRVMFAAMEAGPK